MKGKAPKEEIKKRELKTRVINYLNDKKRTRRVKKGKKKNGKGGWTAPPEHARKSEKCLL